MSIDLHCHSRISDGSLGVDELLSIARRRHLTAVAVTDHDAVVGSTRAVILGKRMGIDVIPGVEFSTRDTARGNKAHLLGYLFDSPDRLEGLCRDISTARRAAAAEMIRKVLRYYPIVPESITRCASGSTTIFKQHIMHALMDYGYTTELYGDVYDSIFDVNEGICAAEVASEADFYPDVHFVTTLIRASGGISVMAHPKVYDSAALLEELAAKHEIDGVEVWHQSADENYRKELQEIASANGLLVTGGSDFHGFYNHYAIQIGSNTTPEDSLNRIITHKGKA